MDSQARTPISMCKVCQSVPWLSLDPEDAPGYPHHASLEALITSTWTCRVCNFILYAAVSNYRRSLKPPEGTYRWRRFETVHTLGTPENPAKNVGVRQAAYVKELGLCMPPKESDSCIDRGGWFTPLWSLPGSWDHDIGTRIGKMVTTVGIGMTDRIDEEPVEDAPISLEDLKKVIPQSYGVWLYGNWWIRHGSDGLNNSNLQYMGVGARFGSSSHMFHSINNPNGDILVRGSALAICVENESPLPRTLVPRRQREMDSNMDSTFRCVSRWIKECQDTHKCTPPNPTLVLPTRVLDVSVSGRSVVLVETRGKKGQYIALSHSWGKSSRVIATKSNVGDLKNGIAVSFLPKTFQDAINITKKLGIQYLWIDCLCIIQDDPSDWEREAAAMGNLYMNSYITISAAACTDSSSGCFPQRQKFAYKSAASISLGYKTKVEPVLLPGPDTCTLGWVGNNGLTMTIFLLKEWLPGSVKGSFQKSTIGAFGKTFDPIADAPLSSRGWTLQERLLPTRIIHYAGDQLYFECDSMLQSEDGFCFENEFFSLPRLLSMQMISEDQHGIGNKGVSFAVDTDSVLSGIRLRGGWLSLVQDYSRRKLTVSTDKLPALAGLARVIAERTRDRYYAGLWATHFYEDLFWRVYVQEETFDSGVPLKGKVTGEASRPAEYRAPSWSWASIDAPVRFIPLVYKDLMAQVTKCETTPSGNDVYGRLKGGRLVIEGPVFELFPHTPKDEWKRHGIPVEIRFAEEDGRETSVGALYLDFPNEPLQYPCYALFIDPGNALILRARPGRPVIGQGEVPGYKGDEEVSDSLLTSEIVQEYLKTQPETTVEVQDIGQVRIVDPRQGRVFQAYTNTVRIGVASFVDANKFKISDSDKAKKRAEEIRADPSSLKLEDIAHVHLNESWGPITHEDPKIRVTVI